MSLFSKLFKLFVGVVLMPVVPLMCLLAFYQMHLKDNILETHANLAQIVSSSLNLLPTIFQTIVPTYAV